MEFLVEAVGQEIREGITHACNCAAMEDAKTILAPNLSAGVMYTMEEGPWLG